MDYVDLTNPLVASLFKGLADELYGRGHAVRYSEEYTRMQALSIGPCGSPRPSLTVDGVLIPLKADCKSWKRWVIGPLRNKHVIEVGPTVFEYHGMRYEIDDMADHIVLWVDAHKRLLGGDS